MDQPRVEPLRPGVAPALDIVRKSTRKENTERAKHSSAVALRETDSSVTQLDVAGGNKTLGQPAAGSVRQPTGSVFVLLEGDLDAERRADTVKQIENLSQDILWQGNTVTVELELNRVNELLDIPGVSYADMSQPICAPDPIGGNGQIAGPGKKLRQVATWARDKGQAQGHHYGSGVLVGIIDVGGFDFAHPDFLDKDGRTRWESIWDQGGTHRPPPSEYKDFSRRIATRSDDADATGRPPFGYGSEIRKKHMDRAIAGSPKWQMPATELEPQSQMIPGSHGTHVASIAAGNHGVARNSRIAGVLVALEETAKDDEDDRDDRSTNFYDSRRIIDAVEYLLAVAERLGTEDANGHVEPLPLVINISLGTNGHAHDASSPVARWIDKVLSTKSRCVTVAAGNAGQTEPESRDDRRFITGRIHAANRFAATNLTHELGWIVEGGVIEDYSENEMEIWYSPGDRINVAVRTPIRRHDDGRQEGGVWLPVVQPNHGFKPFSVGNGTMVSVYSETYHPHNGQNRISIKLSPRPAGDDGAKARPIDPGEWKVRLTGAVVRDGRYDAWIQRDNAVRLNGSRKRWLYPSHLAEGSYTADRMVNSLASVERVLSVANVDSHRNSAHVTSSRGPTRDGKSKPDIGADGTDVLAARGWDSDKPWMTMTGTSMASPYVAGVATLMLGLSPTLTAAQIQGIVVTTSNPLPGHDFQWRGDTGFGVINPDRCVDATAEFRAVLDAE